MNKDLKAIRESGEVPVTGIYDVVVCGSGPAGIGAAVAAAREGANTLLIEHLASVGGISTGTYVNTWGDSMGGPVFDELEQRMTGLGSAKRRFDPENHLYEKGRVFFHPVMLKAVALEMIREAGTEVLFNTIAESAWIEDHTIQGVFIVNKKGRSLVKALVVIDATADGDIAVSAGEDVLMGDPEDGRIQHVNYRFRFEDVDEERFTREKPSDEQIITLLKEAQEKGEIHPPKNLFQPQAETFPFNVSTSSLKLTSWELENIDPTDPTAVSSTLAECQTAALELVRFCRKNLPGYESCMLGYFPDMLGARESRRILGQYTITGDDVLKGRKFEDGIAQACFFMDFHDSPPGTTIPYNIEFKRRNSPPEGDWYEIPYRCLVPKRVKGILVAGRCISCDRDAHASLRIMPTCMYTGTAAGTAAAMAVSQGLNPHEIDGSQVREKIIPKSKQ